MTSGEFWALDHLADEAVQEQLMRLLASGARTEARVIAHIAAVEDRRLHLLSGCSSLFDYCVRRLGLSENEAFHRLTAARLARRFPMIFRFVGERKIHLTGVCLLRDYLTEVNHGDLLREACGKTKHQILELIACRYPRPDVPSTVRKLPARKVDPAQLDVPSGELLSLPSAKSIAPMERLEPTSAERYRLQLTLSAATREKLELARALLRHSIPDGDLAQVVDRALDELLVQLRKKRFGETATPRSRSMNRSTGAQSPNGARRREHITHETRREVTARDGLRCTFESEGGQRCDSAAFLQFHHDEPWARNGGSGSDNLQMLCAAHNRLVAERDFGRGKIADSVRRKRGSKDAASGS